MRKEGRKRTLHDGQFFSTEQKFEVKQLHFTSVCVENVELYNQTRFFIESNISLMENNMGIQK